MVLYSITFVLLVVSLIITNNGDVDISGKVAVFAMLMGIAEYSGFNLAIYMLLPVKGMQFERCRALLLESLDSATLK